MAISLSRWLVHYTKVDNLQSLPEEIGGLENIRSNFDYSKIPKKLSKYYKNCFEAFAKFVNKVPASKQEALIQPVWNKLNVNIKQQKQSFYF